MGFGTQAEVHAEKRRRDDGQQSDNLRRPGEARLVLPGQHGGPEEKSAIQSSESPGNSWSRRSPNFAAAASRLGCSRWSSDSSSEASAFTPIPVTSAVAGTAARRSWSLIQASSPKKETLTIRRARVLSWPAGLDPSGIQHARACPAPRLRATSRPSPPRPPVSVHPRAPSRTSQ